MYMCLNKCQLQMCDLKYMDKNNTHNLFKSTNISLLFRNFITDSLIKLL